ncbi:pyridoxamine 5'-phosphate oxidase family protein [Streptomyces yunnanensis]|uniref:Pyridoxamine 5'-phosphate oxidase family protein n=1 Tax=Streptomyces yunnanensis TaxID=156453 RepID=A0ABY8A8L2_9ACTN|nr:pyridoxamine 5'-phosphate oxidase family protein [Streptomyces yunnanensis]WEB41133.1 pyridoxamine 5'-phosphate oxidase family protein [Streptomyces yunnanensis]
MEETSGAQGVGGRAAESGDAVGTAVGKAGAAAEAGGRAAGRSVGDAACPAGIRRALDGHTTMTLAYADEDGPQACAVLYAAGEAADGAPVLYFVTAASTRHGRALGEPGARAAFTVQRDGQEWSGLTGIQGRGSCRRLDGDERAAGWRAYTARFPFVAADERLRAALERTALWELRPDWLRLIDNAQGFGHKEEWRVQRASEGGAGAAGRAGEGSAGER